MNDRLEVLALIPARGGSKSVPRKNLRLVAGRPLIAHSIEQARRSTLITRVIVSTDDPEIADVARSHGAEVPFLRPAELAQDAAPDIGVFQHALAWLEREEGYVPDVVVHLRPTTPVRRVETIDRAIQTFLSRSDVDSLRSVTLAKQTPFKMWLIGENGCLEPIIKAEDGREAYNLPRQVLPRVYWQNGYIDITHPEVILRSKSMTGRRILSFVIEEPSVEIDYEEDLAVAERLLAAGGHSCQDPLGERFPS